MRPRRRVASIRPGAPRSGPRAAQAATGTVAKLTNRSLTYGSPALHEKKGSVRSLPIYRARSYLHRVRNPNGFCTGSRSGWSTCVGVRRKKDREAEEDITKHTDEEGDEGKTEYELLIDALSLCSDEKLPAFVLRFVSLRSSRRSS